MSSVWTLFQSESRLLFECCGVVFLALTLLSLSLSLFVRQRLRLPALSTSPLRTGMCLQCRGLITVSPICCLSVVLVVFLALTLLCVCLSLSLSLLVPQRFTMPNLSTRSPFASHG